VQLKQSSLCRMPIKPDTSASSPQRLHKAIILPASQVGLYLDGITPFVKLHHRNAYRFE
jgi:hypothetical protein